MYNNVVYIGCGSDVKPLLCISSKNFYYIDLIPMYRPDCKFKKNRMYSKKVQLQFIEHIMILFSNIGFTLVKQEHNLLDFQKDNTHVFYYYNTPINSQLDLSIQTLLSNLDALCIIGHMPNKSIQPHLPKQFDMIGCTSTYYPPGLDTKYEFEEDELDHPDIFSLFLSSIRKFYLIQNTYAWNHVYVQTDHLNVLKYDSYQEFIQGNKSFYHLNMIEDDQTDQIHTSRL